MITPQYRAYYKREQSYYPVSQIIWEGETVSLVQLSEKKFVSIDQVVLQMWTGKLDAMGSKIFEDDIIRISDLGEDRRRVLWVGGGLWLVTQDATPDIELTPDIAGNSYVIGNMLQTPQYLDPKVPLDI